jgi:hypothetical protein
MNRANPKKTVAQKKQQPKSLKTKKTSKKQVKMTTKRGFKTTTPKRATLYAHLASHNPELLKDVPANEIEHTYTTVDAPELPPDFENQPYPAFNSPGLSDNIQRHTTFTIFKPCKNAMQNEKNDRWSWRIREDRGRGDYTNQLCGDDYFGGDQGIYPEFFTAQQAIDYCVTNGYPYTIEAEPLRRYDTKSYADNFKWKGPPVKDDI